MNMKRTLKAGACLAAALAVLQPQLATAEESAQLLLAPATSSPPAVNLAVTFELKFQLAQDSDLVDQLLQAGIDPDDIAAATHLAAGHDGGRTGCFVKLSVSKALNDKAFRLQRMTLTTEASQTVMERRKGELAISATGARKPSAIV